MVEKEVSDLYLTVGCAPTLRGEKDFFTLGERHLTEEDIDEMIESMLTARQKREFEVNMELNTAIDMGTHGRFRVNILRQRQHPAIIVRRIISVIPSFAELRLPGIFERLAVERRGLVLVTGMTGSGKSTSLASMVNYRNMNMEGHIVTIEDPIEYFHEHKKCVITQREIGVDTQSYSAAMKNALRQRPDVILVGEIRDREVMEQALAIAETGHLCLATLHTTNAYQTIERIVNFFPEDYAHQIRLNLSLNLKAIVSQRLIPSLEGKLAPVVEVMLNQGLVRELIMKGEIGKIKDVMEQNNPIGMCTFDQSLIRLFMDGYINEEVAITNSDKPSDMKIKVQQVKLSGNKGTTRGTLQSLDTSLISLND